MNTAVLSINRAYYNKHAVEYAEATDSVDQGGLYKTFSSLIVPGGRILDVGCGTGRDSLHLARLGFKVDAIDSSSKMVALAKSRGVRARQMPMQRLDVKSRYDGIWACASLLHLPRSEFMPMLRKLARALRPGGTMYISLKEGTGEALLADGRYGTFHRTREIKDFVRKLRIPKSFSVHRSPDSFGRRKGAADWLNIFIHRHP
jgi:2-polyprenyl-3-methyl-5-hydroxy-6-metoxy-1,4-benzoquinol methylase